MERFANKGHWSACFFKTWHPIATSTQTIIMFASLGVFFLIFTVVLFASNSSITEIKIKYDDCPIFDEVTPCEKSFKVEYDMEPPIFVYYEIHNYLQNHRRYIKQTSNNQQAGHQISMTQAQEYCQPAVTNKDMGKTKNWKGEKLNESAIAYPCGLIAKSFFTDTYQFKTKNPAINQKGISWPNDAGKKFKNQQDPSVQWINLEEGGPSAGDDFETHKNEHYIVWMRTAALPDFRKLWGKIETKLEKTPDNKNTTILIKNRYDTQQFQGEKYLVLTTSSALGGKNNFLAWAYLITCIICFAIVIVFVIKIKQCEGFGQPAGTEKKN